MFRKVVSGIMLTLLLVGLFSLAINVEPAKSTWTGTVYIRADGSIDPPDAPIITYNNITYTLTDNITTSGDGIVVERDNIIINGAGYTVQGTGTQDSRGIDISGRINVTVKNTNIKKFDCGIVLILSSNNSIYGNSITANGVGIDLYYYSGHNSIYRNNITNNSYYGIYLHYYSGYNSIYGNSITANEAGIYFSRSSNNSIYGNNIRGNSDGIYLDTSSNSSICGNNITDNGVGIYLDDSSNSNIYGNNIRDNNNGMYFYYSSDNSIYGNSITNNRVYGINLWSSLDNRFWHNNFIGNAEQICIWTPGHTNFWDDSYPSGGNYWSDYAGVDNYSGPYQNETGSDGLGDSPYVIDENNQDNYPLMGPFSSFDAGVWGGVVYTIDIISNSTII